MDVNNFSVNLCTTHKKIENLKLKKLTTFTKIKEIKLKIENMCLK